MNPIHFTTFDICGMIVITSPKGRQEQSMDISLPNSRRPFAERCTDWYIIIMLLVFPLFPGFAGYAEITASKFIFFSTVTGLWIVSLAVSILLGCSVKLRFPQYTAMIYLLILFFSWLLSPDRAVAFLGAGRYDGFLSSALYVLIFLGISSFAKINVLYAKALALSISVCALVALLQICGWNPLRLFPSGLGYYDAGIRYSGVFLGTLGNTNILDAVLCLSLPIFLSLYICGFGAGFLIPVFLCVPLLQKAGGDGSRLAMALTLLSALPLLITDLARVRRLLRTLSVILFMFALSLFWQPSAERVFIFLLSPLCLWLAAAGVLCLALSLIVFPKLSSPSPQKFQTFFLCVSFALLLAGVGIVLLNHRSSGTLYELRQVLSGHAEDSFGSSRLGIWRECLGLFSNRPLLGGGPGTIALRLDIHFSRYVPETGQTLSSYVDNAHNVYIGALVNTGILGLVGLLGVLGCSAAIGFRYRDVPLLTSVSLGAMCCAIQEFFGLGLCLSSPLLWLALGLICSYIPTRLTASSEAVP